MQESESWKPTAAVNATTPWLLTVAVPSIGWELIVQVKESLSASVAASVTEPVPLELQVSVAGLVVVMVGAWFPTTAVTLGPISNHATV